MRLWWGQKGSLEYKIKLCRNCENQHRVKLFKSIQFFRIITNLLFIRSSTVLGILLILFYYWYFLSNLLLLFWSYFPGIFFIWKYCIIVVIWMKLKHGQISFGVVEIRGLGELCSKIIYLFSILSYLGVVKRIDHCN